MNRLLLFWSKARRSVLYFLLLLVFLLLQNVVFSHIAPLGVRAMFMPALVVSVGLFEGGFRGGLFGLAAGIFSDLGLTSPSALFTFLYPLLGFSSGLLFEFLLNRRFYSYAVMAVFALFLAAFSQGFGLLVFQGAGPGAVWTAVLLQTLWSAPFIYPAYLSCKALSAGYRE